MDKKLYWILGAGILLGFLIGVSLTMQSAFNTVDEILELSRDECSYSFFVGDFYMGNYTHVYIDEEMMEYLDEIMERDNRSFNQVVNIILKKFKEDHQLE